MKFRHGAWALNWGIEFRYETWLWNLGMELEHGSQALGMEFR